MEQHLRQKLINLKQHLRQKLISLEQHFWQKLIRNMHFLGVLETVDQSLVNSEQWTKHDKKKEISSHLLRLTKLWYGGERLDVQSSVGLRPAAELFLSIYS